MTPAEVASTRAILGLSQGQLAAMLRIGKRGKQTVSEWERGVRQPSAQSVALMMVYLDGYRPKDWPDERIAT